MIVNLPVTAAGKASNGKPCSCGKNVSSLGSVARGSAGTALSYFTSPSTPAGALLVPSAASVIRPSPITNRKFQTIRRVGAPLAAPKAQKAASSPAIAVGSNLFRRPAPGEKRQITNRKFQTNRQSPIVNRKSVGLGDDVNPLFSNAFNTDLQPNASLSLSFPPDNSSSSASSSNWNPWNTINQQIDQSNAAVAASATSVPNPLGPLAAPLPGVTVAVPQSMIRGLTPVTPAAAAQNLFQTGGAPPQQGQTFSQWLNTKNTTVGGLPNWAILAGLGIFGTVIIAGAKKRR